jgi:transcriptional regulator of acetoin/glycerol metabolism
MFSASSALTPESVAQRISPATAGAVSHLTLIEESKKRCYDYGLTPTTQADYTSLPDNRLQLLKDKHRFLFQHALPIMENLYEQIANTQSVILLTSANGTVLHSLGDTDFLEKTARVALVPGVQWSERSKGTNAIGTALELGKPIVVHGDQHFLNANQFLTCSCTPIFDPNGIVIGALDVTGDYRSYHHHTMALARMSAQMIENRMFANTFASEIRLHFHARAEFLGTLVEGIAVFSQDGRFLSANRSAQYQLGMINQDLRCHTLQSLFAVGVSQLMQRLQQSADQPISLDLHNGVKVWCTSEMRLSSQFHVNGFAGSSSAEASNTTQPSHTQAAAPKAASLQPEAPAKSLSGLSYLDTGDPQVAAVIQKLRMVQDSDIPVMILGETGTGKDLLAQAIHHDSKRAKSGKFISVNCASIPESLIESELFGYEEGAFTGARKKGAMGLIQAADGGTLFLDEIGDMPHHLQARLLRVLQERKVTPLGAGKEIEVDIAIVCATNKNLKGMIAKGEFREDLYYRLNGLVVRLPALRERKDFETVARRILATLQKSTPALAISDEVMHLLKSFHWPGNFRQLYNLLRTSVALAQNSRCIDVYHLPDDFMEEMNTLPLTTVSPITAPAAVVSTLSPMTFVTPPTSDQVATQTTPNATPKVTEPSGQDQTVYWSHSALEDFKINRVTLDAMAQTLRNCKGNVSVAAKILGVSRNTIYRKKHLLPQDVWE